MLQKTKLGVKDWGGVLLIPPLITVFVLILRSQGVLQTWELGIYDFYLRLRPPLPTDERIAIVGITDADLQKHQTAFLPDQFYANLIRRLNQMQPHAIGLDIYRDVPVEPGHEDLQAVFQATDRLVGIAKVRGQNGTGVMAPPAILAAKGRVGANDVLSDADNHVRRAFIHLHSDQGELFFSFGVYLALLYLEAENQLDQIQANDNVEEFQLNNALFPQFKSNTGGYVKALASGYQVLLNYRGGKDHFEIVSADDVLEDRLPENWGRDRIILIGPVSEGFQDFFLTPYSGGIASQAEFIPGVEVQAHLTSQILSTALGDRPPLQAMPDVLEWLWTFLWTVWAGLLTRQYRSAKQRNSWQVGLMTVGSLLSLPASLGGLAMFTYVAILQGWWLPVIPPLLGFVGTGAINIRYQANKARQIRETFGRYLTNAVVSELLDNPGMLKLGGKRQNITILTSDVRGFTALSERFPPEEVVGILNVYLEPMLKTIVDYGGTVNSLMGDGILAFFGVPTVKANDTRQAVACAIAMQLAMEAVNTAMEKQDWPQLEMGIGINTGEAVVGNLGSDLYTQYSAIGSEVNLAFRVETYTQGSQVFISENTLNAVGHDWVSIRQSMRVKPKGVIEEIAIYEIAGVGEPYNLSLPQDTEVFTELETPLGIVYVMVEGKQVSDRPHAGRIVQLSRRGAMVQLADSEAAMPKALANLKLNLVDGKQGQLPALQEDMYGKVTTLMPEQNQFVLHFTYRSPAVTTYLQACAGSGI